MTNSLTPVEARVAGAVSSFSHYANELQSLVTRVAEFNAHDINDRMLPSILNGDASAALQRLVPLEVRKQGGLFFTSAALAEKVADYLAPMLRKGFKILDPACGAGSLLLACARHLPVGHHLHDTLACWAELLVGYDLHLDFVRSAQLRLALLALSVHPEEGHVLASLRPDRILKGLKAGDAFAQLRLEPDTCVAVNPPFGYTQAPADCKWATGRTQVAALFLERLLCRTREGQHVVAILPDVLRSGTRYRNWRNAMASLCASIDIELAGRFDDSTDVDVFIIHATTGSRRPGECEWPTKRSTQGQWNHTVSDFFEVRVGPVVPHRDPLQGPSRPYIHARTAPAWQTVDFITEERRCAGAVFSPPFLVVHRTSSPSDAHRCVATIVNETRDVAVENHLLVLQPHDRSLQTCEQLLRVLESPQTDSWLNDRIRCRHLTVSAIRDLPCCAIESHDRRGLSE